MRLSTFGSTGSTGFGLRPRVFLTGSSTTAGATSNFASASLTFLAVVFLSSTTFASFVSFFASFLAGAGFATALTGALVGLTTFTGLADLVGLATGFFATGFLGVGFFATGLVTFLAGAALTGAFFATGLVTFLAGAAFTGAFFATGFLAGAAFFTGLAGDLAADFATGFLATGFALVFLRTALVMTFLALVADIGLMLTHVKRLRSYKTANLLNFIGNSETLYYSRWSGVFPDYLSFAINWRYLSASPSCAVPAAILAAISVI